jgi:glucosamine kinase
VTHNGMVIGIDGGGTTTRALCVDLEGAVRSYHESGGANPQHNADAHEQIQAGIRGAIAAAGREPGDVRCLVAGIAGLNERADQEWAERYTNLPGLTCPRLHLNDTVVAHAAAFGAGPGVIAIAGTGSAIFAVTATGRRLHNDDFHHYAGGARHMAFVAMHRLLLGEATDEDETFVTATLRYWQVPDLSALREVVIEQSARDYRDVKRAYGGMAELVTAAAGHSPLARGVCDHAARGLATGIRLLGRCFAGAEVPVVLIGGLARSPAMSAAIAELLGGQLEKRYRLVEPALPPVAGAALLALRHLGIAIDDALTERVRGSFATVSARQSG